VIDALHPGLVNLNRVNYNARYPEDFTRNLKLLDDAFSKLHIAKVIHVDRLSK
jgi:RP/EB family microtubule-associated protein